MPGYNEIILEVEGKKYTSDNVKFKYYQTQSVKTILGNLVKTAGHRQMTVK